jgi:molybdopterin converting factor small subunit
MMAAAATIVVQVRYLSALRDRAGLREEPVELPAGARLRDLAGWLDRRHGLRLPDPLVMATLNGRGWTQYAQALETPLEVGDQIALFPVVGGG